MEVVHSVQGSLSSDGDWLSPRISFSHDCCQAAEISSSASPTREKIVFTEDELSFDFCSSMRIDPCAEDYMISADELFCDGKLRPLQTTTTATAHSRTVSMICSYDRYGEEAEEDSVDGGGGNIPAMAMYRDIHYKPRSTSMSVADYRSSPSAEYMNRRRRACLSTANSRSSSPSSKVKWMHRATTEMPVRPTLQQQPLPSPPPPTSAAAMPVSSSFRYSNKFKEIFRLKKTLKDPGLKPSSGAQVCRELPHHSGSVSSRLLTAKSFWPFSRSNSAGESKSQPAVSPLPRRSNSAGESKTTSSSLLHVNSSAQVSQKCDEEEQHIVKESSMSQSFRYSDKQCSSLITTTTHETVADMATKDLNGNPFKTGLPPLPNNPTVKISSYSYPALCSSHSDKSISMQESETGDEADIKPNSGMLKIDHIAGENEHSKTGKELQEMSVDAAAVHVPTARSSRGVAPSSPAIRQMRRCPSNSNAARSFARGSPGRRSNWNSPSRGHGGGRIAIKNLDRGKAGSSSSRGLMRPKDMLNRDGSSVRIPPVLNVPVPSRRGIKVTKSKILSLGSLFSKKDKSAGSYVLLASGAQNGG